MHYIDVKKPVKTLLSIGVISPYSTRPTATWIFMLKTIEGISDHPRINEMIHSWTIRDEEEEPEEQV